MTERSVRPLLPRAAKVVARPGLRTDGRGEQTTPDGYPVAKGATVPDAALSQLAERIERTTALMAKLAPYRVPPVDTTRWPCALCGHGHYPGKLCLTNGCLCRA